MVEIICGNHRRSHVQKQGQKSERGKSCEERKMFSYPERRCQRHPSCEPLISYGKGSSGRDTQHYVFIYNDSNQVNRNGQVLDRATFIGNFRTLERFPQINFEKHSADTLLNLPDVGNHVKGKLYAVDNAMLADLDYLAQVGVTSNRKIAKVTSCHDRSFVVDAFLYFQCKLSMNTGKEKSINNYEQQLLRCHRKSAFRSNHLIPDFEEMYILFTPPTAPQSSA